MIKATITKLSQEFNLQTKQQMNFAVIELPNGFSFSTPIDDQTAQAIVNYAMNAPPTTSDVRVTEPLRTNGFHPGVASDGSPAQVFGGGGSDEGGLNEALLVDDVEQKLSGKPIVPPPSLPVPTVDRPTAPIASTVKPRFLGSDEYGYPRVEYPNGVDPKSVTGTIGEGDEDGVRQL